MRPRWAWLLWVQLGMMLLATLGAYLGLLDLFVLAVPGIDKILHFLLYGALAFFAVAWWADRRPWAVLGILCGLAALEESSQSLSAARTFSTVDLTATLTGILAFGSFAGWLVHRPRHALIRR
jgi:VanZ family protein